LNVKVPAVLARSLITTPTPEELVITQKLDKGNLVYLHTVFMPKKSWLNNSNENSMFDLGLYLKAYMISGIF